MVGGRVVRGCVIGKAGGKGRRGMDRSEGMSVMGE